MPSTPAEKPFRDHLKIIGPAVVITLLGFIAAYQFVDPAPPQRISIATGGTDGAYFLFAQRYREILARNGIDLEVRSTAGSIENLGLLEAQTGGVEVAFVQGGTRGPSRGGELLALGSLYFEPLWVFHRADRPVADLSALRGKRLAIGGEGSGTRAVALQLLADNAVSGSNSTLLPLSGSEASEALHTGGVDAVFLVASAQSPTVQRLLLDQELALLSFNRAAAYTRLHRFLSLVTLPQGVVDMAGNIPGQDVVLLAPTANLVARADFHPALVNLLLQAAAEVHAQGGLFEQREQFPSPEFIEFSLSPEAKRFYRSGPPFLQRFLPFWAATVIDRMLVMLLPLVALAIPLLRVVPPMFRWRVRSRIYRWYRELLAIDPALFGGTELVELSERVVALDRLEGEVSKVSVPMSYADQLYHLRLHIQLVREKLNEAIAASTHGD